MADGRTRPLAELQVGDAVYGTALVGHYRRYTLTRVLAHWQTVKPAYRITLEDGTELLASGDHRFLTRRGWKHVTGTDHGRDRRPHLTTNDELMGTGAVAAGPDHDGDYKLGYLCGMVRGDGHLGSYSYLRPGRASADVHRFRLALVDIEALRRSRGYLAELGVRTSEFLFAEAAGDRRQMWAIRNSTRSGVDAVRSMACFPTAPSRSWHTGFLAGIFDAEGSYQAGGSLRISNTDQGIIDQITSSLRQRGFRYAVETVARKNPVCYVRLLGGPREHLRFLHETDPAITRKRTIDGVALKSDSRLGVVSVERLGVSLPLYDITTGTGDFIANGVVSHNCFARSTHTYLDLDAGRDFDTKVVVKINTPELVRAELARRSWRGEHIAMGTNVDCYQRAEGRYRLMPGVIEALRDAANPFSILTKGTLVLRDLPLLAQAAEVTDIAVNVSVGFTDPELWRAVEPGTPSPARRLEVCAALAEAGVGCGVLMAPVLPYLTDSPSALARTVQAIAEAGARHVTPIVLHLRPGAREWYLAWLARTHPRLVPRYRELYRQGAYAPAGYQQRIAAQVSALAERYRMDRPAPAAAPRVRPADRPGRGPEQPRLL
jgi:DNA repair photolyase